MLKQYRIRVLLWVIVGIALCIPLWIGIIAPYITRLPTDFSYSADLVSTDNFYSTDTREYTGATQSSSVFEYTTRAVQPGVMLIDNRFTVEDASGQTVVDIKREYGIHAITRAHVPEAGERSRTGYLFAPKHAQAGKEFTYWHVNYNAPASMRFVERVQVQGLEVFHYSTVMEVDQTEELDHLPFVGETQGIVVDVALDTWIEPRSGWMVKYTDRAIAYVYDLGTGERLHPWNAFSNTFTDEAISTQTRFARQARFLDTLVFLVIPAIMVMLVCVVTAVMIFFRIERFRISMRRYGPYVVIAAGIILSGISWSVVRQVIEYQQLDAFRHDADTFTDTLVDSIHTYERALQAGKSFLRSSEHVTRDEWKNYAADMRITTEYPGMLGFGFAPVVFGSDAHIFEQAIRASGLDTYAIRPASQEAIQTPILYLEPANDPNNSALGYDMYSESVRRRSLERARDTGVATLTSGVQLVQEHFFSTPSVGVLLYVPVYTERVYTIEDRRRTLSGYVYAPLRMDDVVSLALSKQERGIAVRIQDNGTAEEDDAVLYADAYWDGKRMDSVYSVARTVFLYGRKWQVNVYAEHEEQYSGTFNMIIPWLVGGLGVVLSVVLGMMMRVISRAESVVNAPRSRMTKRK